MSKLSEEELTRFEVFTRSRFPRNVIKAVSVMYCMSCVVSLFVTVLARDENCSVF